MDSDDDDDDDGYNDDDNDDVMMCAGVRRVLENYRRHQAAEDRTDSMDGDLRKAAKDTQGAKVSPAKQMGRELGKSN